MATRKFLYVNTDTAGFVVNDTDLSPSDVVDLQGAQLSNLKDPVASQDAATRAWTLAQLAAGEDFQATAATGGITQFAAVCWSAADEIGIADSSAPAKCGVIGLVPAAIAAGVAGTVRKEGVIAGCLTGAIPGMPYYLGHAGLPILASALVSTDRIVRLGFAKNATDLWVDIEDVNAKKP